MSLFHKSKFTVAVPVQKGPEEWVALYQTMTGAFVLIREATWSYILSDPTISTEPGTTETLREQGLVVDSQTDEGVVFENWRQRHVHGFDTIKSKVLVTRKCNNRCRYCILDPEAKDMSSETARAMDRFYIETIRERHPDQVDDDYLGGEPLLNMRIILESAARRFYFCMGRGIEYGFVITTNGTRIGPEAVSDMKQVGLKGIRVSMAGPGSVHDALRPLKNGGKTYHLILENLKSVSGMIPIFVECQYDASSREFLRYPEMLQDFLKYDIVLDDIAFTPVLPKRGNSAFQCGTGDPNIFLFLRKEARKYGYCQKWEPPYNACMADFRSKFVFDTDGSIIPCPSLQGGEMAYGHVNTGIDFVAEAQLLNRSYPDACLNNCAFLPICLGGCRLQALTNKKDFAGTDCHYETYRLLLEDYLREQASRIACGGGEDEKLRTAA